MKIFFFLFWRLPCTSHVGNCWNRWPIHWSRRVNYWKVSLSLNSFVTNYQCFFLFLRRMLRIVLLIAGLSTREKTWLLCLDIWTFTLDALRNKKLALRCSNGNRTCKFCFRRRFLFKEGNRVFINIQRGYSNGNLGHIGWNSHDDLALRDIAEVKIKIKCNYQRCAPPKSNQKRINCTGRQIVKQSTTAHFCPPGGPIKGIINRSVSRCCNGSLRSSNLLFFMQRGEHRWRTSFRAGPEFFCQRRPWFYERGVYLLFFAVNFLPRRIHPLGQLIRLNFPSFSSMTSDGGKLLHVQSKFRDKKIIFFVFLNFKFLKVKC